MEMSEENKEDKIILPHHEALSLCTSRLPYRQGRKLTAVKVYTVNSESNHLLVFGVPSLNLRQETKALFMKFGKLRQFSITTKYLAETFTENYHVVFENIQSARIAKKMLDTKNFYGGSLHICYAPELEDIEETRIKLFQRHKDVTNRLRNLKKNNDNKSETDSSTKTIPIQSLNNLLEKPKVNMGEVNILKYNTHRDYNHVKNKRKMPQQNVIVEKKFKPCFEKASCSDTTSINNNSGIVTENGESTTNSSNSEKMVTENSVSEKNIEIIDFTSTEQETLTNIDEGLNYKNFGNEVIKKIPPKPVNKIKFNIGNKR